MPLSESSDRDIAYLYGTELVAAYRRRTLSPVEVTTTLLRRLERVEPRINAFVLVARESALKEARAAEARWMKGAPMGLLDGVPVTIKDLFLTKGWPTRRGSTLVKRDQPWDEDAPPVARLREHGAVLLGKTTMPEFGWKALGDSPLTGITRNPWNLAHTPGGSTAGAAARRARRRGGNRRSRLRRSGAGVAHPVVGGRGQGDERVLGRRASAARPRPRGIRAERRAAQRHGLARRRPGARRAVAAHGEIPSSLRSAADPERRGAGAQGRRARRRSRNAEGMDRLVALQLSLQPHAAAGGAPALRLEHGGAADRPAHRPPPATGPAGAARGAGEPCQRASAAR